MIKQLITPVLIGLFAVTACNKDKDPVDEPDTTLPRYLLKTITWDLGVTSTSSYSDSILQKIDYAFQGAGGASVFTWNGQTLTELHDDRSLYKNVYEYDSEGKLLKITNTSKSGTLSTGYTLEFQYKANKKVDSLKYFIINEAGKQLQAASSYHYKSSGELDKVITKSGSSVITHTIDQYSPEVSFNPCHYISTSLDENYTVYNYAVMTQLNRINKLPAKITRLVKTGSQTAYVDKIEEHVYTVSNYRIDKVINTITYPGVPASNRTLESVYSYY